MSARRYIDPNEDIFGLVVGVPPDIGQPANRRGVAALGASVAVGGIAATFGYLNYACRHKDVPDSPIPFMRHYAHDAGIYGAWRWGLFGLGATALLTGIAFFALGA